MFDIVHEIALKFVRLKLSLDGLRNHVRADPELLEPVNTT
jgi:hypothetical protein